jgi:hypothetical protein
MFRIFAYLDPLSGSVILQALLATLAALSLSYHLLRRRVKIFFSKIRGRNKTDLETEPRSPVNDPEGR